MKELGYFGLLKFARDSHGPFCFYNMVRGMKTELVWSDEDFEYVTFNLLQGNSNV